MNAADCSVLVVDDDPAMRESMADVLREEGHCVLLADDGKQGLETLRAHPEVRVVLLDVMMPVMNGLEFLAAKIRDRQISAVPVLLMTAHHQPGREVVGVSSIFTKPFDVPALLREIRRLCGRGRLTRAGEGGRSARASGGTADGSGSSVGRA